MLNTKRKHDNRSLDVELGPAPVTTLSVVLDLVVGLHAEPVRNGSVRMR